MSKLRVALAGATGYAGEELVRILLKHPSVELTTVAASAKWEKPSPLSEVLPGLTVPTTLCVEALNPETLGQSADLVFLALPHGISQSLVPRLLERGCKVIDLAGDYRLKEASVFNRWYGSEHTSPELLARSVYGLTEWNASAIAAADLVANPGCYATAILLAMIPIVQSGLVETSGIIVDAKSGLSGAGKKPNQSLLFAEMNENLWAYKVGQHQHSPEIEQAVSVYAGKLISFYFVPHVVPLTRGIHADLYFRLKKPCDWAAVNRVYQQSYDVAPFVRMKPQGTWPEIRHVSGTNFCHLAYAVDADKELVVVTSAIDNLVKGAAGQAVQNMNIMSGYSQTAGLLE